jgi:hypothetical protein
MGAGLALVVSITLLVSFFKIPYSKPAASLAEVSEPAPRESPRPPDNLDPPAPTPPSDFLPAEEPLQPVFVLSDNDENSPRLFQGWPLLVCAQLMHPQAFAQSAKVEPMLLAAADGPWTGVVHIEVQDAKGTKLTWSWRLATVAKPQLTLDNKMAGYVAWWLTPEQTAAIPPGEYELKGVLDTTSIQATNIWKGIARSEPVHIKLLPEPKPLGAEHDEQKSLLLARYSRLRGDPKDALAQVDALLSNHPKSIAGLELSGDLLAEAGQVEAALRQYEKALSAFKALRARGFEPSRSLLRKHQNALVQFLKK